MQKMKETKNFLVRIEISKENLKPKSLIFIYNSINEEKSNRKESRKTTQIKFALHQTYNFQRKMLNIHVL